MQEIIFSRSNNLTEEPIDLENPGKIICNSRYISFVIGAYSNEWTGNTLNTMIISMIFLEGTISSHFIAVQSHRIPSIYWIEESSGVLILVCGRSSVMPRNLPPARAATSAGPARAARQWGAARVRWQCHRFLLCSLTKMMVHAYTIRISVDVNMQFSPPRSEKSTPIGSRLGCFLQHLIIYLSISELVWK